jgi:hypothetical protein
MQEALQYKYIPPVHMIYILDEESGRPAARYWRLMTIAMPCSFQSMVEDMRS